MKIIADQQQREAALNPKKSFIVQAPAGSGKTELLTQRFLVLLAQVKQPEEILAITFTKKSSAEMRARIINALNNAENTPEPEEEHAKTTWKLAKAALVRDQINDWNLLKNPNRLRIQTIDSFNAYLIKQFPLLSNFGAPPDIIDDPTTLYRTAVQEFLMYLEDDNDWSNAIAQLLLHLDNDFNKVEDLLINLLKKRDQWLPYITLNANDATLRERLEKHLAQVVIDALKNLQACFPKEYMVELIELANFATHHLLREHAGSFYYCVYLTHAPDAFLSDRIAWQWIGDLILTKEHQWRKQFTKTIGFPAASSSKDPDEKKLFDAMKKRMSNLSSALQSYPELISAITALRLAPDYQYQETQWQLLDALHQVLRVVVAQLKLVFQQHGKIDYIESAQGALVALGTEESPTDLILALDYKIQHILIDEFQDTSNTQYRLIEKLTAGWTENDGHTLFLVGDPMQSIYRFREAEVGYFIRARQAGLNHIRLEPLTLSVNFRSVPGIVNWLNQYFPKIFPPLEDIATGAVSYSPSIATHDAIAAPPVTLHAFINAQPNAQANNIVQLILRLKQENPDESIAILVRSRTHLISIIPALRNAKLLYKAIDIDPLTTRPVIQDLMALTRALLHPADRIAWLAILRAPWCGLLLSDLLLLTRENSQNIIWEELQKKTVLTTLSNEGQQRLERIIPILKTKIADRHRFSLRSWLENTWLLLGGPACTTQESDLDDATAYFKLLDQLDKSGEQLNLSELERHVGKLFATPNHQADHTLQIMTIHNAKGLEFDTVILPHLERQSPNDDKQLLLWMERPHPEQHNALLIAPINATGYGNDTIYDYIKRQHAIKNDYESARLLYVATTRAKKRLQLFFSLQQDKDILAIPASASLLDKLWHAIAPEIINNSTSNFHHIYYHEPLPSASCASKKHRSINRLTLEWMNPVKEPNLIDAMTYHNKKSGFQLVDNNPKYVGIFLHQILQQICLRGVSWWESQPLEQQTHYCVYHLTQLGMLPAHLTTALENIFTAIKNTLSDPRGQWILKSHNDVQSELQLTALIENQMKSLIIDRTFIDESNTRWIIDYKIATPHSKNIDEFLHAEKTKYINQLTQYAKAIHAMDQNQRAIQLGLYFPLIPAWQAWKFDQSSELIFCNNTLVDSE